MKNIIGNKDTVDIRISGLKKEWITLRGKVTALHDLDLYIKKGSFFVLLGPSGCGKSTLLNTVAGLENASKGSIVFGDKVVTDADKHIQLEPKDRDIAMVFQSYALYPHFNVRKNIAFPLTNIKGMLPSEITERVNAVAEMLKISDLLDRKPSELSGGQRQRVAIGRALVRNPKVFLMDEPLSNLDAILRNEMRAQLKELQTTLGVTTIYVTHDQLEAMTLADEIAILNQGLLQQVGTPDQIYDTPKNIFVAKFIGSPPMNILWGSISDGIFTSGNITLDTGRNAMSVSKIALGVRPENITISDTKKDGFTEIPINFVEHIGHETIVYTSLNDTRVIVKTPVKFTAKIAYIYIDKNDTHLFNESEERIL